MRSVKRDPAPSRLIYRAQRLWLRPSVRRLARFGPIALILGAGIGYCATNDAMRSRINETISSAERFISGREEFRVASTMITGASPELEAEIYAIAHQSLPASSLKLDLNKIRNSVENLGAVEAARVRIARGGSLSIDVSERRPVVLWRNAEGLFILDSQGVHLGQINARHQRADLPLLTGAGAENAIPEAQELIQNATAIYDRLRGLERVGARRWDMVLDRGQVIMLPEIGALDALHQVMALQGANKLMERDVIAVDMRDPQRPVLRLGPQAVALRQAVPQDFRSTFH